MFDWWNTQMSVAVVVAILALRFIGQPVWDRYVGWHMRIRHHVWCFPVLGIFGLVAGGTALFFGQVFIGECLVLSAAAIGLFLLLLVGARCPECGRRLIFWPQRYGPASYRCRHCGFQWTGWTLRDELPD